MRIPKRIEYSVRALAAIAHAEPATVNARLVADTVHIPPAYLYGVLSDLRRAELVYVVRGSQGGYTLARPAREITLGEVVRRLDGAPPFAATGDRLDELWEAAAEASLHLLDGVTLADLATAAPSP
jgi:Rrf2 family protein